MSQIEPNQRLKTPLRVQSCSYSSKRLNQTFQRKDRQEISRQKGKQSVLNKPEKQEEAEKMMQDWYSKYISNNYFSTPKASERKFAGILSKRLVPYSKIISTATAITVKNTQTRKLVLCIDKIKLKVLQDAFKLIKNRKMFRILESLTQEFCTTQMQPVKKRHKKRNSKAEKSLETLKTHKKTKSAHIESKPGQRHNKEIASQSTKSSETDKRSKVSRLIKKAKPKFTYVYKFGLGTLENVINKQIYMRFFIKAKTFDRSLFARAIKEKKSIGCYKAAECVNKLMRKHWFALTENYNNMKIDLFNANRGKWGAVHVDGFGKIFDVLSPKVTERTYMSFTIIKLIWCNFQYVLQKVEQLVESISESNLYQQSTKSTLTDIKKFAHGKYKLQALFEISQKNFMHKMFSKLYRVQTSPLEFKVHKGACKLQSLYVKSHYFEFFSRLIRLFVSASVSRTHRKQKRALLKCIRTKMIKEKLYLKSTILNWRLKLRIKNKKF